MEQAMFTVVKNHEDQYSIWAADRPIPAGWVSQGIQGTKEECLEYIRIHWVDMTPASLKKANKQVL
jgi:MbtH protein